MKKIMKYAVIAVLMLGIAPIYAIATPIVDVTGEYFGPVDGVYTYSYTVHNNANSQESVWEFWLYPTVPFMNVGKPNPDLVLWDFFTDELSFIQWVSTDPDYDIVPGSDLSGFSFESTGPPGITTSCDSGGYDSTTGTTTGISNYASGKTIGPIPEPSTILLLATGLMGVAGYCRAKSRRSRKN